MSDLPPAVPDEFVAQLARDVKAVRERHADNLAATAMQRFDDDGPDDDERRAECFREFLRFAGHDVDVALFNTMAGAQSSADERSLAARLYLYGTEQGFWKAQADTLRLARNLYPVKRMPASASGEFDLAGAVRLIVRANGQVLMAALVAKVHEPGAAERDRLLAMEKVLLGVQAGLWALPAEWEGTANG